MTRRRGNSEGTIYYDEKKGRWVVQVTTRTMEGHRRRPKYYFATQKAAAEGKSRILEEIRRGTLILDDMALEQFVEEWLRSSVATRTRPRTLDSYSGLMRLHVLPTLGDIKLTKLTPAPVQRLLNDKLSEGLSPTTVQRIRDVLRNALNQAVRWGYVSRNVVQLTDPPKVEPAELVPWSLDEARQFLKFVEDDRLHAAFLLAAVTGMRRGELLGLRWEDVDLERGVLSVRTSMQRLSGKGLVSSPPKTAQSRRTLQIAPAICNALGRHRERQHLEREFAGEAWEESGYLFTSLVGTPMDPRNLSARFQELVKKAGVRRVRLHDLRHFAATVQLMDGAPVKAVQAQLGHSNSSTTLDIYGHVSPVVSRHMAERIAELVFPLEGPENCPPIAPQRPWDKRGAA